MAAAKKPTLQDVVSDDLNYELWAPTMKTTLTEKGLWDVVENLIPADLSKISELATETPPEDLPKWRDFMGKDREALKILQSCLPDSVLRLTLEANSAKDLWDLLKEANEKAKFEKKLEQDKIKEGERISSLLMEIANDSSKSNYLAIAKMVISLSDSYENETDELILKGLKKLTFNRFRWLLDGFESSTVNHTLYEILKKNGYGSSPHDLESFIKWLISMSDSYDGAALVMEELMCMKNLTYNNSRELFDLFELVPLKTINCSNKKNQSRNVGPVTFDEDMWMLYTNTTNHMTPYIKYFSTLDRSRRARIQSIVSQGMGDVRIMTKEGKTKMIKNVLYVPGMDRNVLSAKGKRE
ncbi:unnamed protein product [Arabidopsis halleri]